MEFSSLPMRPKGPHSESFRKCDVVSNHYKVNLKNLNTIYIYSAKFDEYIDDDNKRIRNKILESSIHKLTELIGYPTFSGGNIFTLEKKVNFQNDTIVTLNHQNKEYKLILKLVKTVNFKSFAKGLQRTQETTNDEKVGLNFLNNLLRNFLRKLKFIEIGKTRKFFDPSTKTDIPNTSIQLFKGYTANFCFLESGLYLKVDSAIKLVRGETVLQYIQKLYDIHRDKPREEKRAIVNDQLRNKTIMANYGNSMYWRIEEILFDISTQIYKLKKGDKDNITLYDYYKKKYNKSIKEKSQPLIKAKSDRQNEEILLIPQFCLMTGLPDDFDERKRREISLLTNVSAEDRKKKIQDLVRRMNRELKQISPKIVSDQLGINIEENLSKLEAKKIPVPDLALGEKCYIPQGKQSNFQLFDKPLYNTTKKIKCICIHFDSFDPSAMQKLFKSTSSSFKLDFELKNVSLGQFSLRSSMDKIEDEIQYRSKKDFNIFLIIIPPQLKSSYKKIKKICILKYKIVTQIVVQATLKKNGFASIATKILLQIATKVGNVPWISLSAKMDYKIMLIGIDTNTDKLSKDKKIIGFCASLNKHHSKFYSTTLIQQIGCNINSKMKELIVESCNAYFKQNSYYPDEIIILRDGCGVSQIKIIREFQVTECLQGLKLIDTPIRLSYIVIDKKVNEKFFGTYEGRTSNPAAGTLINSGLVSSSYDFYLISQYSNKGTVIPTYYKVIYNDSKLQEGKLQQLIYSQCYNYMNWTGSIKIPAPVQYAKKLSTFVSQYINEKGQKELNGFFYYI